MYRAEYDLDRNGVINGSDVLLAQSAAAAALPAGWVSASGPAGGPDSIVGYGGYLFNRETMCYTVRHRHYSPALGRFLERDPMEYIDGTVLTEYVSGAPLTSLDPLGLAADDDINVWLDNWERRNGGQYRAASARDPRNAQMAQEVMDGVRMGQATVEGFTEGLRTAASDCYANCMASEVLPAAGGQLKSQGAAFLPSESAKR